MEERIATGPMAPRNDKIIDVPVNQQRSLATVTAEIRAYQDAARRMAITYCVEVGRRLCEAKDMVAHGEWGTYLRTELGYSQSRANDLMRIFEAYAADQLRLDGATLKSQAFGNLSYTQAIALLALPSDEEREAFVAEHDMSTMSTRELREELRRRGEDGATDSSTPLRSAQNDEAGDSGEQRKSMDQIEAERELQMELIRANSRAKDAEAERDRILRETEKSREKTERAEQKAKEAASELEKAKAELKAAKDAEAEALKKLHAAEKDKSVPKKTLDKLRKEAEEAAEKSFKADYEQLDQAQKEAAKARQEAEAAARNLAAMQAEKEALEKELRLAAPEMAVFKASFERVQGELLALVDSVDRLPADKQAGAWKAMAALVGQIGRIVEAHTEGVRD